MARFLAVVSIALALIGVAAAWCKNLDPVADFNVDNFEGTWHEIGKIQTFGGAFWQQDCVCTNMEFAQVPNNPKGDAKVTYSCRSKTPTGSVSNFPADLEDQSKPGKWKQSINFFLPRVDWTVLVQTDDYALTYDCGSTFGITNYCIHIMARERTLDEKTVQKLVDYAESLGLNPNKLKYQKINQEGCID